jgi:cell division protein ZapA
MSEGSHPGAEEVVGRAEFTLAGRSFVLGCAPGQEARLRELAARLDGRVRELIEAMGDVGAENLLAAAALSYLDELDAAADALTPAPALPPPAGPSEAEIDVRLKAIELKAAGALVEAASRLESLARRIDEAR